MALKVAIGSVGAIGKRVAERIDAGIEGLELVAVSANNKDAAAKRLSHLNTELPIMDLGDLADHADVVVECAPSKHFREIAEPVIAQGKTFVPLSVGALLPNWDLVDRAAETGASIRAPSGAILGLDALRAAAEGEIFEVRMITRKHPRGLAGAPHLEQNNIDVDAISEATCVFEGSARDGAKGFPANVNVAAAVALAGAGPDKTRLEIWADPAVDRNLHTVKVDADSAAFEMHMRSIPTPDNPRTGLIVANSVIAVLRGLAAPLVVGA